MAGDDEEVLIHCAAKGDATHASRILEEAGIRVRICANLHELAILAADGCGCVFITQESVPAQADNPLVEVVSRQPEWSDLPFVVGLVNNGRFTSETHGRLTAMGNVLLVERPLSAQGFVTAIQAGLRARARQYLVRELMSEREELLSSLERRVAERTAKLTASVEQLEAFSYTVSHDLRSPLRTIAGYADMLLEDHSASLSPEAAHCAQRISRAAQRLATLTTDLLTYARIAIDELPVAKEDLDAVVRDVIEEYPSISPLAGHIKVQSPLGAAIAHRPALSQCISNLLENALRFAKPGEEPRVKVYSESHGARIRLSVADEGVGIAPQYQGKIFKVFETLSATKDTRTGIGLSIVQKAVERMGGTVGVISALGEGATFWIELPGAEDSAL